MTAPWKGSKCDKCGIVAGFDIVMAPNGWQYCRACAPTPETPRMTADAERAYHRQSERVRDKVEGQYGPYTNQDWADVNALHHALAASQQEVADWKRLKRDCDERNEYLNTLVNDLRASLALAQKDGERLRDVLDCGTNALLDSILASGNHDRTNLHWVRKMRRDSGLDPASPPPAPTHGETNGTR